MKGRIRLVAFVLAIAFLSMAEGCGPGGVGMGVSSGSGGARWGGTTGTGPGIVVGGGPAY
jgi:hypothetical protein